MAPNTSRNKRPYHPPLPAPSSPPTASSTNFQSKCTGDEVPLAKKRRIISMPQAHRLPLAERNGGGDPPIMNGPPPSNTGSDCGGDGGGIEFTKESIEALLNERSKVKNRFNIKEKCEQMVIYIKRLKDCIKWFQQLEGSYVAEIEKLKNLLEVAERTCDDTEMLMKANVEKLNSVITDLRQNNEALQEKLEKTENDKLEALDSYHREIEARRAAEKLKETLSEDLKRAQSDVASHDQMIHSLGERLETTERYNSDLQRHNSEVRADLKAANATRERVETEKVAIMTNLINVRGLNASLKEQLATSRESKEEAVRQKEALASEVGLLRGDLQQVRADRDRQAMQVQDLQSELAKNREYFEQTSTSLYTLSKKSNELEAKCISQSEEIIKLREKLCIAEEKSHISDMSVMETRSEFANQKAGLLDLQNRLANAESVILEGEKLRKKLHNTILELKGNIRVFCRVRPLLSDDPAPETKLYITFPTASESMGRGIDLNQNGQKHSFTFDKVFMPDISQETVFTEISQLVQSALDGYKVCIFAYGQTGSGKTYTMMGKPGNSDQKGLIPRTLEQVFETRQNLQMQGWKYDMQVSMLEIYNETIRDLLSPNRAGFDTSRVDNGGKQYSIKHDSNGNTHVSDLTIVEVCSSKEVSYLLERAAQSRSVGKTQMNEQSSRSHFVFTLRIQGFNESTEQQVQGVLNLIDLAGSERLSKSGSTGDRLKETQAINKSLSSLSDVIFALAKKDEHVPFRNSKLTYLLQPCLGGDSKTLMFVNISPDPTSVGESLCSLRFAARVNTCEIGVPRRQTSTRALDSRLSIG